MLRRGLRISDLKTKKHDKRFNIQRELVQSNATPSSNRTKKVTMAILHYVFADEDWEKVLKPQSRAVFLLIKADYHMQEKIA